MRCGAACDVNWHQRLQGLERLELVVGQCQGRQFHTSLQLLQPRAEPVVRQVKLHMRCVRMAKHVHACGRTLDRCASAGKPLSVVRRVSMRLSVLRLTSLSSSPSTVPDERTKSSCSTCTCARCTSNQTISTHNPSIHESIDPSQAHPSMMTKCTCLGRVTALELQLDALLKRHSVLLREGIDLSMMKLIDWLKCTTDARAERQDQDRSIRLARATKYKVMTSTFYYQSITSTFFKSKRQFQHSIASHILQIGTSTLHQACIFLMPSGETTRDGRGTTSVTSVTAKENVLLGNCSY